MARKLSSQLIPQITLFFHLLFTSISKAVIPKPIKVTIAVVALKPLDDAYKIKRIIYSTYQAVSGAGKCGIEDLENGINNIPPKKFPHPIFNNCIPHIDDFTQDGYTKEEYKMIMKAIDETKEAVSNE